MPTRALVIPLAQQGCGEQKDALKVLPTVDGICLSASSGRSRWLGVTAT